MRDARQMRFHAWQQPLTVLIGTAVAMVAACAIGAPSAARAAEPACFGAASRDALHPCHNPRLDRTVAPPPSEALIMPNTPCSLVEAPLNVCQFGMPATPPTRTIALVGDSHAWHWRAAVEVTADALGWQAFDSTRSSCPFTAGVTLLSGLKQRECVEWNRQVPAWLGQRPDISTVFISDHPGPVVRRPGQSLAQAQVAGYIGAWQRIPPTVTHIVVIRDIPYAHENTLACVERAMQQHRDAGTACAVPRTAALRPDPEGLAAQQLDSPRVQVIDLTSFFCDARLCYPVIGGALVYRDADHLTRTYAATLGPYLLREVRKLMSFWG